MGRPLLSFVLLAYNQEAFVAEAVEGAFAQSYQPLEIILSDDCSEDRTFEIMEEMVAAYSGPHRVRLNRNEENLGLIGHVNRAMKMAGGRLLVMAAGDDVSLENRVSQLYGVWAGGGFKADGLASGFLAVSPEGGETISPPETPTAAEICRQGAIDFRGATAAWTKRLVETWGPLPDHSLAEDQVLLFRAVLSGGLIFLDEPLIRYSVGSGARWKYSAQEWWSHRRVWKLKRVQRFLEQYRIDLDRSLQNGWYPAIEGKALQRSLESSSRKVAADLKTLGGSRVGVVRYCLRVLVGATHHRVRAAARIRIVLSLIKRRVLARAGFEEIDVFDHRALKQDVVASNCGELDHQ